MVLRWYRWPYWVLDLGQNNKSERYVAPAMELTALVRAMSATMVIRLVFNNV